MIRETTVLPSGIYGILFLWLNLLHVAAALFHTLVRSDGVFDVMAPVSSDDEVPPAESLWRRRL
jgi:hypothetical protein